MDEDPVDPLPDDRQRGHLVPELIFLAHHDVSQADGDPRRNPPAPAPIVCEGQEERHQLERKRVPAKREQLEEHESRVIAREQREEPRPPGGEISLIGPAPIGEG